jgi:hypothetical protein
METACCVRKLEGQDNSSVLAEEQAAHDRGEPVGRRWLVIQLAVPQVQCWDLFASHLSASQCFFHL